MNNKLKFRFGLGATFVLGAFLAAWPWSEWAFLSAYPRLREFLQDVLPRIGDALMIAPLLAIAVEVAAAQELLEDFVKNVSHHIIGHLLPPHLREHILGYLTTSFVRTRWFVEYQIAEWPDRTDFIKLTTFFEYELENRSDSKKLYNFSYDVEESWFPEVGDTRILQVSARQDNDLLFEHDEEELRNLVNHKNGFVSFSRSLAILRKPHGVYRFSGHSVECSPSSLSAPFVASVPVLETTVRILYPKNKFRVDLYLSFADEANALVKTKLEGGDQWIVNSLMLPGQCFVARWARIKITDPGASATSTAAAST
jgi:hypothetical protein